MEIKMKSIIKVKCPYCKIENNVLIDDKSNKRLVVTRCDTEEGGCDKPFVVEWDLNITTKTATLQFSH